MAGRLPGTALPDLRCALHAARRALAVFSSVARAVFRAGRELAAMSDILGAVSGSVGARREERPAELSSL